MGLTEITRRREPRTVKTTVSSRPASICPNANCPGFFRNGAPAMTSGRFRKTCSARAVGCTRLLGSDAYVILDILPHDSDTEYAARVVERRSEHAAVRCRRARGGGVSLEAAAARRVVVFAALAADAVVVLEAFDKKTEATPAAVLDTCRARFAAYLIVVNAKERR